MYTNKIILLKTFREAVLKFYYHVPCALALFLQCAKLQVSIQVFCISYEYIRGSRAPNRKKSILFVF